MGGTDEEEKESREVEGVGPGFISGLGGGGEQADKFSLINLDPPSPNTSSFLCPSSIMQAN